MVVQVKPGQEDDGGYRIGRIHITRRELDTLALFANGISIEESANKLGIKPQTVKNHLYNIVKKLRARNRTHALVKLLELGMIETRRSEYDREEAFGEESRSEYLWCLHCERTYKYGEYRLWKVEPFVVDHVRYEPEFQMCPYEDCDGDAVIDAWEWDRIRESHPEYPEIPEKGKVYPMYGERKNDK